MAATCISTDTYSHALIWEYRNSSIYINHFDVQKIWLGVFIELIRSHHQLPELTGCSIIGSGSWFTDKSNLSVTQTSHLFTFTPHPDVSKKHNLIWRTISCVCGAASTSHKCGQNWFACLVSRRKKQMHLIWYKLLKIHYAFDYNKSNYTYMFYLYLRQV